MMYYRMKAKLALLLVSQAVLKHFVIPVTKATGASIQATLSLPQTVLNALQEAKQSAEVRRQLENWTDDTLIDRMYEAEFGKVTK